MRKLKKLMSVALAGAMALAMSVSVFAAGISSDEQKILDTAKARAVELGVAGTETYKNYVAQAESYLTANDLSSTQANAMVNAVNAAATKASQSLSAGQTLFDLSKEELTSLFKEVANDVKVAANAVGITMEIDANGNITVHAPKDDGTKTQVGNTGKVIKQTGTDLAIDKVGTSVTVAPTATDMTTTVVLCVMFVGAVAVCGVVAKKKKLFSSVEA